MFAKELQKNSEKILCGITSAVEGDLTLMETCF